MFFFLLDLQQVRHTLFYVTIYYSQVTTISHIPTRGRGQFLGCRRTALAPLELRMCQGTKALFLRGPPSRWKTSRDRQLHRAARRWELSQGLSGRGHLGTRPGTSWADKPQSLLLTFMPTASLSGRRDCSHFTGEASEAQRG